jgi:hypothetical protein
MSLKKTETVQLLAVVNAAFPNMQVTEVMVNIWHELLGDLDFGLAKAAVKKLLLESPYPPTIADIRKQVVQISTPLEDRIDGAQAWGEVEKAIQNYGYYRETEALANMPPRVAKVVRYIGWREICLSDEPGVVRGQFMKMFPQVAEREQKERLLPAALRKELHNVAESYKLIDSGVEIH